MQIEDRGKNLGLLYLYINKNIYLWDRVIYKRKWNQNSRC